MRFIDPFGLDTIPTDPNGDPLPIPLPGVDIKPTPPASGGGFIDFMWRLEYFMQGNHNPRKNRDATGFEKYILRNFDQDEVKNIGEAVGDGSAEGTNRNTVNTDASYEGRYPPSDKEIYENSTGSSDAASPENQTIVKTYTKKDESGKPWYRKDSLITKKDAIYPDTMWVWRPNSNLQKDTSVWVKHGENAAFQLINQ